MRDIFWGVYHSIAFKKCYYLAHQRHAESCLFAARLICGAVSIVSVLVWGIARSMPVLWACLIALAQLAQAMLGYLPWSQQLNALRYLLPELDMLLVDLNEDWLRLAYADPEDADALAACAVKYDRAFYELEHKYANDVWFPLNKSICDKAEDALDDFLRVRFQTPEGGERDGSKETDAAPANA